MNDEQTTDLIEQYLLGQSTIEQQRIMQQRMETDVSFRQAVAFQQALIRQARQVGRADLRQRLKDMATQSASDDTGRIIPLDRNITPPLWRSLAVAASVTAVLLAGIWFWRTTTSPETPLATNRQTPTLIQAPRQVIGGSNQTMGFAIGSDSTYMGVLLYPAKSAQTGSVLQYRFDDTLRLYGSIDTNRLSIRYNADTDQYQLQLDTATYPLKRYKPVQPLR